MCNFLVVDHGHSSKCFLMTYSANQSLITIGDSKGAIGYIVSICSYDIVGRSNYNFLVRAQMRLCPHLTVSTAVT
jgi:hypothetical protein